MRLFYALFLYFSLLPPIAGAFTSYPVYLDNIEDDDQPISVFKTPGQNWKHCKREIDKVTKKEKCVDAVGWPDRDSTLRVVGPSKKFKSRDPLTDELILEEYSEIEFNYRRKGADGKMYSQKGIGYIESFYLSKKPTSGFYSAKNSKKEDCPPGKNSQSQLKDIETKFKDLTKSVENLSIAQKADALSARVGFCPLKPPTQFPSDLPQGSVYDALIVPQLMSEKPPAIRDEAGQPITKKDVVAIDALARTMYGEMARCYRKGLQYPMAVARIAVNRAETKRRHQEFIKPPQKDDKPDLAKVTTSASQFSMWRKTKGLPGSKKPNEPLHQALCPPIQKNKPFWKSQQAPAMESDIWKNTVRIATEAVLHPIQFKKRTAQIDGFFYTSDLAHLKTSEKVKPFFRKMNREYPSIEGKELSDGKCVEVWKE